MHLGVRVILISVGGIDVPYVDCEYGAGTGWYGRCGWKWMGMYNTNIQQKFLTKFAKKNL